LGLAQLGQRWRRDFLKIHNARCFFWKLAERFCQVIEEEARKGLLETNYLRYYAAAEAVVASRQVLNA